MNATIRIPATNAQIQARPYPSHGFDVLASVRLDLLAEALGSMEHDDTDPDVVHLNADQCRDALLRQILLGWSPAELVEARIPGAVEMAQDLEDLRATLSRVEAERDALAHDPTIQSLLRCRESGGSLFFNAEFEGVEFVDGSDGKRTKVQPYTPGNPNPTRNPSLCTQFVHDHLDATTEGEKP